MKLSMWSSYYWDLSPEEAIAELAQNGYAYTELSDEHGAALLERGDAEKVGADFGRYAREHGVLPEQGHLWLRVPLCDPEEERVVSTLKRWLDLFQAVGITSGVLHCDSKSFPAGTETAAKQERNAAVLRRLTDYVKGSEFVISLENLHTPPGVTPAVSNAQELLEVIRLAGGGRNLGVCLDTGHLNLVKERDQAAFIRAVGDRLTALHIADNDGSGDQHLLPFARGTVDLFAVMHALREVGYDRLFNLEVPGERSCPLEIRGYKLRYFRNVFDYLSKA